MAVRVTQGFEVRSQEPIDSRIIVVDETARLATNSVIAYNGLVVSQQSDDTLWLLIDSTDPSQASNWEEITGKVDSDGNTSAITEAAADGKVISAITVNSDGLVTSASAKTLGEADIPSLPQSKITGLGTALDGKVDEPSGVTSQSILTWDGSNSSTVRLGALATMDSISVSNTTTYDYTSRSDLNTLALALAELYADDSRIHQQGDIAIVIWSDGTNNHTETLIYTGTTQTTAAATLAADWTDISADLSGKVDVDSAASAETIAAVAGSVLSSITVNSQGLVTDVASKTLIAGDIPNIEQSQVTGLTTSLDGKVDEDSNTSVIDHAATTGSVINSITVNADGLVTAATQKALVSDDIPTIEQSQVTGLTTSLDGKVDEDSNTSTIEHAAATGEVINSITVNADGLVTAATQKLLEEADIPTLSQSKITNLTTNLASKVDEDSNTSAIAHAATTGEVINSITVNEDGLVTEATQKALEEADIPTLSQSKITSLTDDLASKVDEPSGVTVESILTWDGTDSGTVRLGALASMDSISVSNTTTYNYTAQSATINTLALALAALYAETSRAHEQGDIAIVIWSDGTNSHTETLIFTGTSQTTAGASTASDWTDISADLSGKVDVDSDAGAETINESDGIVLGSITVNSQGLVTAVGSKTLDADDIPTIAQSQVTNLTTDLSGKVNTDSDAGAVTILDTNTNFISNIAVNAQGLVTSVGVKAISADDLPDTGLGNIVNGSASNTNYDVPSGDIFWRSSDAVYWNTGTTSARVEIDADGVIRWPSPDPFQQLSHTNITVTRDTSDGTLSINSSDGTDGTIPLATASDAGIVRLATNSGLDVAQGQLNLDVLSLGTVTTVDDTSATEYLAVHTTDTSVTPTAITTRKISLPNFIDAIQATIDLAGERITSGTVAAERIADLAASKITSGEFADARIPNLNASKINAGEFADARIPNLNASKINAGEFSSDRIPNLNASKITAGEFSADRIPDLNASKITAGEIADERIPDSITRDSEISVSGNTLTYPGGTWTPTAGEDNQTITTGDGVTGADGGESGDFTIDVDLSTDSGLAFYSGKLGASFQDETISLTSAGRNLIARGNHNHNGQYVTESSFDHFSGTLDSKLEQLIEDLSTNEGRVREQIYEHFEVAADIFTVTAVTDPGTGETENEVSINTSNLPSGVNHLPGTGQTLNRSANGVIFGNDAANQVVINSHIDTFSTVARQGNNYESSTTIADALETAFNNLPSSSQDSAEVAILLPSYTAGSGSFETNECLIVEVPFNAGESATQQVDWVLINGVTPVQAQFDEMLIFFFDGQLNFRTHAAGTVRISVTQSGDYENLAERIADANDNSYDLFISFTDRDGAEHNERVLTSGGRPNFREWDHWGPYLDIGIRDEGGTTFRVEPGSYVHLYETQSITIHETPHRVNVLDTANTTGATELNWYAPTRSLATSTDVSSSTSELTIRSESSSSLTDDNRYFIRTGNDLGGLDAGEWYSARYTGRSTDAGGTEDGYIFDTIRNVHGDEVTLTAGSEISTSLWQVFDRSGVVTRGSGGDITIQDESTALTTAATTLNFTGDGVTATGNGAIKTISIPGGGGGDVVVLTTTGQDVEANGVAYRGRNQQYWNVSGTTQTGVTRDTDFTTDTSIWRQVGDGNTTYDIAAADNGNDVDLTLTPSTGAAQTIQFTAGSNITLTEADGNNITISATDNNTDTRGTVVDVSTTNTGLTVPDNGIAWVSTERQFWNVSGDEITGVTRGANFNTSSWLRVGHSHSATVFTHTRNRANSTLTAFINEWDSQSTNIVPERETMEKGDIVGWTAFNDDVYMYVGPDVAWGGGLNADNFIQIQEGSGSVTFSSDTQTDNLYVRTTNVDNQIETRTVEQTQEDLRILNSFTVEDDDGNSFTVNRNSSNNSIELKQQDGITVEHASGNTINFGLEGNVSYASSQSTTATAGQSWAADGRGDWVLTSRVQNTITGSVTNNYEIGNSQRLVTRSQTVGGTVYDYITKFDITAITDLATGQENQSNALDVTVVQSRKNGTTVVSRSWDFEGLDYQDAVATIDYIHTLRATQPQVRIRQGIATGTDTYNTQEYNSLRGEIERTTITVTPSQTNGNVVFTRADGNTDNFIVQDGEIVRVELASAGSSGLPTEFYGEATASGSTGFTLQNLRDTSDASLTITTNTAVSTTVTYDRLVLTGYRGDLLTQAQETQSYTTKTRT